MFAVRPLFAGVTPHSVTIPSTSSNYCTYSSGGCSNEGSINASVSDGVGPFTYQWNIVSNPGAINFGSLTGSSLSWSKLATEGDYVATVTCTVTDTGNGNAGVTSNQCEITSSHYFTP